MIDVNNLSYSYKNKLVLDKISFTVEKGSWVSLVGSNGSGKTTLMKILLGILEGSGYINIDGIELTLATAFDVREKTGAILSKVDNMFIYDKPIEELRLGVHDNEIDVCSIAKDFNIGHILNKSTESISNFDKHMLALAISLEKRPSTLIIDETFMNLCPAEEKQIIDFIYNYTKDKGITVINITHNPVNVLLSDKVIALYNKKVLFEGTRHDFFENEDVMIKSSLTLPFTMSLIKKLSYYNLVENNEYDFESLVNILWK